MKFNSPNYAGYLTRDDWWSLLTLKSMNTVRYCYKPQADPEGGWELQGWLHSSAPSLPPQLMLADQAMGVAAGDFFLSPQIS